MLKFSITEILIVVTTVAVAAAGIAQPGAADGWSVVTAVLIGLTIAGPPLLWRRRRRGELTGLWGLGEIVWFSLGLYFLPLLAWCIVVSSAKAHAERWLLAGVVLSVSLCAVALLLRGSRAMVGALGGQTSGRRWFVRRGTNWLGLAILALLIVVGTIGSWSRITSF